MPICIVLPLKMQMGHFPGQFWVVVVVVVVEEVVVVVVIVVVVSLTNQQNATHLHFFSPAKRK